mmetsp:Transcript_95628/g.212718  ORF Transcript_95628/g.212718 Transcript_95628/m.212718 type:complete len:215 (-) Transcript_95628:8-652(-)
MRRGRSTALRSGARSRPSNSVRRKGPRKLVCQVASMPWALPPPLAGGRMTPALLMSSRSPGSPAARKPCASSTKVCTVSRSVSSKCTTRVLSWEPKRRSPRSAPRQPSRRDTEGCRPSWRASSAPMPLVAPVMTTRASSPAAAAKSSCNLQRALTTRCKCRAPATARQQQPPTAATPRAETVAFPAQATASKARPVPSALPDISQCARAANCTP